MKILILPDLTNHWSAHNRAKAIQKFIPEYDFAIRAGLHNEDGALSDQHLFDLVHFNFSYGLTGYYDFIMANRHKVVITVINERSFYEGYGVDRKKFEEILRACSNVTSVSKRVADQINVKYIPNGIDEDLFNSRKTPVVGYSGTNRENKNVDVIIQACCDLGLAFHSAYYQIEQNAGQIPHEQMKDFYRSIDVFVHTSLTEGFNNTIIEALACNVPVLMTQQGCWHEFEGWVDFIEPTVEGVKSGLRRFTGRRLIDQRFLWKNIIPEYKKVYEEAFKCAKI